MLPFLTIIALLLGGRWCSSNVAMASPDERGTRLIVNGQVFDESGTKPVPGVTVYAYHTDAKGYYNRWLGSEPRLHATLTTNAEGRFELRTIRPGSYPGRRDPAHIHLQAWGAGYPKQWLEELQFADDPKVTKERLAQSRAAGRFGPIVTTKADGAGTLHATYNVRLKRQPEH